MANPEHLRLFSDKERWNEWRQQYPDIVPDLREVNLSFGEAMNQSLYNIDGSGSRFHYMNLGIAELDGALLVGASFHDTALLQGSLVGVDLRGINLSFCTCSCVNLNDAKLQGAFLVHVIMNDATLCSADLRKAIVRKACLERSDLRGANLAGIHASECQLYDANVAQADITGADFRWANLSRVNLLEARSGYDLMHLRLRGATFSETNLRGALMRGMDLRKADFDEADLRGTDLRGANFTHAFFRKTMVEGALFEDAILDWDQVIRADDQLTSKYNLPYYDAWIEWDKEDERDKQYDEEMGTQEIDDDTWDELENLPF